MKMQHQPVHRFTRRTFLAQAATAAGMVAAPWLLPASVFGKAGAAAPSERIGVGVIGIGAMGRGHLRHCLRQPDAQVLAVCDVDTWRRENAKRVVEQTYATDRPGGTFRACVAYNDLRDLLARDDVDAVVIATGDNWHGAATVLAARAGKDIYCEKPVSKTIVSHLGCIAHWTRQALRWDPVREQFLDNDAANRLRGRAMRAPWEV